MTYVIFVMLILGWVAEVYGPSNLLWFQIFFIAVVNYVIYFFNDPPELFFMAPPMDKEKACKGQDNGYNHA